MTRLVPTYIQRRAERMGADGSLTLRFLDLGTGKGPVRLLVAVSDETENGEGK